MHESDIFGGGDWRTRLDQIVATMRDVSHQTDPQEMVRIYRGRMAEMTRVDGFLSLTRRGFEAPAFRVARDNRWTNQPDPWIEPEKLPVIEGGILSELIYGNEPQLINDFHANPNDPGFKHLEGMRSLAAIPVFDGGEALNLVVHMRNRADAFDPDSFPQMVWMTNLFSRATHNLVLSRQLATANAELDAEHAAIGEIQRSLLPKAPPWIPTLEIAVHYRASGRAGGDYYDFLPLDNGCWGILIADVAGHGPAASVLMAITHTMTHLHECPSHEPAKLLRFLNRNLCKRYTGDTGRFVSALYGIYDPSTRRMVHSVAGHPRPRVVRANGSTWEDPCPDIGLALGIDDEAAYQDRTLDLGVGDSMLLFTDGANETRNAAGELFGIEALDALLAQPGTAASQRDAIVKALASFNGAENQEDDLTLVVVRGT